LRSVGRSVERPAEASWRVREESATRAPASAVTLSAAATVAALDMALEAIGAPALVLSLHGQVLHANTTGRTLLRRDQEAIRCSLERMTAAGASSSSWSLAPLRGAGGRLGFLAILRPPVRTTAIDRSVSVALLRWSLTARQGQVLELVARGLSNAVVADTLQISEGTVEFHLSGIFDKAGVDSRAALIARLVGL
jgi:DNA-binding NarL/FixJ family response regulator